MKIEKIYFCLFNSIDGIFELKIESIHVFPNLNNMRNSLVLTDSLFIVKCEQLFHHL